MIGSLGPFLLSSPVLFLLFGVNVQTVFGPSDVVFLPEGLVQLFHFRHEWQAHVQVHLQVLQPSLQFGESRATDVEETVSFQTQRRIS